MTNEQLEQWIDDLQSGMYINCVYCGHRYGPNSGPSTKKFNITMRKALEEHISSCPKHPLSAAKAEITVLKESVESWKREYRLINAAQIAAEERVKELEAENKRLRKILSLALPHEDGDYYGPTPEIAVCKAIVAQSEEEK